MSLQAADYRFVSIDIETTGLDERRCEILEIGAVICDPFEGQINWPEITIYPMLPIDTHWEDVPREMHKELMAVRKVVRQTPLNSVSEVFANWLESFNLPLEGFVAAGKNFSGFDKLFLERKIPGWRDHIRPKHRVLDPAPFYYHPLEDGVRLPNLSMCLKRAGFPNLVGHRAADDAMLVARLVTEHIRHGCVVMRERSTLSSCPAS